MSVSLETNALSWPFCLPLSINVNHQSRITDGTLLGIFRLGNYSLYLLFVGTEHAAKSGGCSMAKVARTIFGASCFAVLVFGFAIITKFANTRQNQDASSAHNTPPVRAPHCPDINSRPANLRNWVQYGFIKIAVNEI